jgi:hypothetical protein
MRLNGLKYFSATSAFQVVSLFNGFIPAIFRDLTAFVKRLYDAIPPPPYSLQFPLVTQISAIIRYIFGEVPTALAR